MNNSTICKNIDAKINLSGGSVLTSVVNSAPPKQIHLQTAYTDTTTSVTTAKWITEPFGTQYTSIPLRTTSKRFEVNTNTAGLIITVQLELIDESNNTVYETLTTNGTTYVATTGSTYKVCIDMTITSASVLTGSQRIWCRAQSGTQNNIYHVVLGPDYKYNPVFMCGNLNGATRNAVLVSLPQLYTGTQGVIKCTVWGAASATSTTKLDFNRVAVGGQQISNRSDGLLKLVPGEWCLWYRLTDTSVNTICNVNASWEYFNA